MSSDTHEGCPGGAWCRHCLSLWCGNDGCGCECPTNICTECGQEFYGEPGACADCDVPLDDDDPTGA